MEGKVNNKFSNLPAGWEVKTVEQIFDFYPTASYSRDKMFDTYNPTAIGYIHYGDIHTKYNLILDVPNAEIPYISEELKKDFEYIKEGDLILSDTSEDYEGVGKCIEILNVGSNKIISGLHTLMLRQKGNDLIDGFKGYLFSGEYVRNSLLRIVTGIKVYSIAKAMLGKVDLPIPSIQEQKEITTILSKVDEAIASVQNSIAAAERLKKSLMQNLLTGKMKPDGTFRTPDEFYIDEKFGKVPVGWHWGRLSEIADIIAGQSPQGEYYNVNGAGKPMLNGPTEFTDKYPVPVQWTTKITKLCKKGDILFTVRGSSTGRMNLADQEYCIGRGLAAIRPKSNNNISFIYYTLLKISEMILAEAKGAGTTFPNVSRGELMKKAILIPDTRQNEIIAPIEQLARFSDSKQRSIDKLEILKKSLMQNLLTGKVYINSKILNI